MESQRHVLWNILPNTAFSLPPYLGLSDESCSPCAVLTEREFRLGAGGLFPRLCLTGPGWTLETPRPLRPEAQALLPQPPSPASAARSPTDPRKHRGSSSGLSEEGHPSCAGEGAAKGPHWGTGHPGRRGEASWVVHR